VTEITQAFVLGAGLGTRLRPLTDDLPKPLVPIFQKPLITFALDHLIDLRIEKFFINTHHRPERFTKAFPNSKYRDRQIQFFHEPELLETAGGIANISDSLGDGPLLVYNGDILTDLPLPALIDNHCREKKMVTLALRSGRGPKHIAFDPATHRVTDISNALGSGASHDFVFTGIYIVERAFVDLLERGVKRSVIPHFLEVIRREKLGGVVINEGNWWDVGTRESYLQLHRDLQELEFPSFPVDDRNWKARVHETAAVDANAELRGCSVVGRDCEVSSGATLEDTILWPGAKIASHTWLQNCIVRSHRKVAGVHRNIDI
jgi:NDP-sugar pyrophosphorylase family protein